LWALPWIGADRDNRQPYPASGLLSKLSSLQLSAMVRSNFEASFVAKLHVAAFLFKIAARDPAFGRWMRVAFVIAITREFAKTRFWLIAACTALPVNALDGPR
jgi:hypothetical protein